MTTIACRNCRLISIQYLIALAYSHQTKLDCDFYSSPVKRLILIRSFSYYLKSKDENNARTLNHVHMKSIQFNVQFSSRTVRLD